MISERINFLYTVMIYTVSHWTDADFLKTVRTGCEAGTTDKKL